MALFGSKKSRSEKILEDVDEYIRTGNELLKKGDIEGANSSFRKGRILLMKFDTSDMPLETANRYTKIAYGIMETGDDEIAMECADLALELNKKEIDAYLVKGAIYLKRNRMYNQALLSFNDALKINPKHEKALELKAGALEKRKQYKRAYMIYRQLVEISDNPDKYRKKMDAIKKRLKLSRAGERVSREKKDVKISMEHPPVEKKAIEAEEPKAEEVPEPVVEAVSKAEEPGAEGEIPEEAVAKEIPEKPEIEVTPGTPEEVESIGAPEIQETVPEAQQTEEVEVLSEPEGRPEEEIEVPSGTEEAVEEVPSEPEADTGEIEEKGELPSEVAVASTEMSEEVVETPVETAAEPSVPEPSMEEPAAEEEAKEEVEIDVEEVRRQANAAFEQDDYEKAEGLYEQLAMAGENDIDLYYNLGVCYYSNGRLQDAVDVFNAILEADPDDTDSWLTKGATHFALKEYDKAIDSFNNVLKRNVNEDAAWYYKACSEALRGNSKLALTFLERAISLDENYREIAADDESFASLKDDPKFKEIVGQA